LKSIEAFKIEKNVQINRTEIKTNYILLSPIEYGRLNKISAISREVHIKARTKLIKRNAWVES
jgi:hypothetical protein